MKIILNKYNYIHEYSTIGDIEGSIEVPDVTKDPLDYQYINENLLYNPIPKDKPTGVNIQYNGEKWIEEASLEEQEEFYRNKIINLNHKIIELENIGLGANKLKIELEKLKLKHQEITHLLGLEIDKTIV